MRGRRGVSAEGRGAARNPRRTWVHELRRRLVFQTGPSESRRRPGSMPKARELLRCPGYPVPCGNLFSGLCVPREGKAALQSTERTALTDCRSVLNWQSVQLRRLRGSGESVWLKPFGER